MDESPVWKPDCLVYRWQKITITHICVHWIIYKTFINGRRETGWYFVYYFLWISTSFDFFHSSENVLSFRQFLKIISQVFHMEPPYTFKILMLVKLCSGALLGFSFLIISPTWSAKKWNDSISDSVWTVKADRSLLVFMRGVHWSANYKSKWSHFVLMSDTNFSLWQIGIRQGIFYHSKLVSWVTSCF